MKQLKQYWWAVVIVFGLGGWGTALEMAAASGKATDAKHEQVLSEQHKMLMKLGNIVEKLDGKMDVVLLLLGMEKGDSLAQKWSSMPKSPPLDSLGEPINGAEWLCVTDGYYLGRTMKWTNGDSVLVRVEWDKRKE